MYDTHDDQAAEALRRTSASPRASLLAFQRDLEARGIADRVVRSSGRSSVAGREENGSRGTDHGAAGIAFVLGSPVAGAWSASSPGLGRRARLGGQPPRDLGLPRLSTRSLLEQWLETDAGAVIPDAASFARPALIAA